MNNIENILMCPNSHENLKIENSEVRSTDNKYCYKIEDGIYRFLNEIKSSETENVKKFYMEDPFPNYNSFDNLETFIEKMKNNSFINSISKILKPGDRVLEFGCGTGQLGNYLAANGHSEIFSADLTINSLKLGNEFTKKK